MKKTRQLGIAFRAVARAAWTAALSPQVAARYRARATRPQIGDMVIEVSNCQDCGADTVGRLLMANPSQGVWRILTLSGMAMTWENAEFVASPDTSFQRREFTG